MDLGVLYSFQDPPGSAIGHAALYERALEQIEIAEDLGYEWVNLTEHHVAADGYLPAVMPVLAAIAATTSRIRLSTGMLILSLHHPLRIAEEAAVVDLISGGRLTLGVAVGYRKVEFDALGIDYETRGRRFRESLEILVRAWSGEPFSYEGEIFSIPEVVVQPRPSQRPHPPLWLGGTSEVALRRAVKWGSPCFPGATDEFDAIAGKHERYRELLAERGDGRGGLVIPRLVLVADTIDEARRRAFPAIEAMFATYQSWGLPVDFTEHLRDWRLLDELVIVGDDEYCADQLQRYRELGTTDLMAQFAMPGVDPAVALESLRRFAVHVPETSGLSRSKAGG
jgi:probable F420-dependent oxidoreductase